MTLGEIPLGRSVAVVQVGGDRAFRRRLMELGLLPGTRVEVVRVAPLGDPMELSVRGCLISIRREEASLIGVCSPADAGGTAEPDTVATVGSRVPASP